MDKNENNNARSIKNNSYHNFIFTVVFERNSEWEGKNFGNVLLKTIQVFEMTCQN